VRQRKEKLPRPATQMSFIGGNLPADLADRFARVAERNERKVAAELRVAIRSHVEAHENGEAA
jgi:hypothetical protein